MVMATSCVIDVSPTFNSGSRRPVQRWLSPATLADLPVGTWVYASPLRTPLELGLGSRLLTRATFKIDCDDWVGDLHRCGW
jgi:hypothetical protein